MSRLSDADIRDHVEAFVASTWSPAITVGEWWRRLAEAGLSAAALPVSSGGRGWGNAQVELVRTVLAEHEALGPPAGFGLSLVASCLTRYGTSDQLDRLLPRILDGRDAWCQLFSEPNAGSDLAALETRAVRHGDAWVVDGEKVWTSDGFYADFGLLLARTDSEVRPRRLGITAFAMRMDQPGVDVQPLREMTGGAEFCRVTMSGARVDDADRIGEIGGGWEVVRAVLAAERSGYRPVGGGFLALAHPGRRAGLLDRPAGEVLAEILDRPRRVYVVSDAELDRLFHLARASGRAEDPVLRQGLATLYTLVELSRLHDLRGPFPGSANVAKLLFGATFRTAREVANAVVGAGGMLSHADAPDGGWIHELTVFSPGPSIYGGTDEIQRTILGERVLGLPAEPRRANTTAL